MCRNDVEMTPAEAEPAHAEPITVACEPESSAPLVPSSSRQEARQESRQLAVGDPHGKRIPNPEHPRRHRHEHELPRDIPDFEIVQVLDQRDSDFLCHMSNGTDEWVPQEKVPVEQWEVFTAARQSEVEDVDCPVVELAKMGAFLSSSYEEVKEHNS